MQAGDDVDLEIVGLAVACVCLDTSVEIQFGESRDYTLRIETQFEIRGIEGETRVHFSPSTREAARGLDALAAILGESVVKATARSSGALVVRLSNQATLHVGPDEDYEAWTFASPEGVLVSLPGGGLG